MPTYDYICDACEHELEAFQSITEKALRKCPACGKSKLRRLIGAGGGLIFKGSGFYITDYRSGDYKAKAEAEKPSSGSGEKKGAGDGKEKSAGGAAKDAGGSKPKTENAATKE